MIKWEYYILGTLSLKKQLVMNGYYLKNGVRIKEEPVSFFDHLQKIGNEGWELVIHDRQSEKRDRYIFKREIKNG